MILKGDSENQTIKGSVLNEDVARKYSAYLQSILHHNNGYFTQVNQIIMKYFYRVKSIIVYRVFFSSDL